MLDLRLPIGWFFIINAILLIAVGIMQPQPVPLADTMINLDLIWGAVMGAFGLLMAGLSYAERLKNKVGAEGTPAPPGSFPSGDQ